MNLTKKDNNAGFSLLELIFAMTIVLVLMGIVSTLLSSVLGVKTRETQRAGGITSTQAALNVMSREIGNSGFGLMDNGLVADSNNKKIHFRANIQNNDSATDDLGENVTYFYEPTSESIMRYDACPLSTACSPSTTVIINGISEINILYLNYNGTNSTATETTTPTVNTGRVRITLLVKLDDTYGQPLNRFVTLSSDVTLRNSNYMLNQY